MAKIAPADDQLLLNRWIGEHPQQLPEEFKWDYSDKKRRSNLHQLFGSLIFNPQNLLNYAELSHIVRYLEKDKAYLPADQLKTQNLNDTEWEALQYLVYGAEYCSVMTLSLHLAFGAPESTMLKKSFRYQIKRDPTTPVGLIGQANRQINPLISKQEYKERSRQYQLGIRTIIASGGGDTAYKGNFTEEDIDFITFADDPRPGGLGSIAQFDQEIPSNIRESHYQKQQTSPDSDNDPIWNLIDLYRQTDRKNTSLDLSQAELELYQSYIQTYITEANESTELPPIGHYIFEPRDVPMLANIRFEQLRIAVKPKGFWIGLNYPDGTYAFGWWSPNWQNLSIAWQRRDYIIVMDCLCACLWRDLKIVKEKTLQHTYTYQAHDFPRSNKGSKLTLQLPRTIYRTKWGSDEDREEIQRAIRQIHERQAHWVKPFVRKLPDGHNASQEARNNALDYGYPEPSEGFTFVKPFTRGEGEPEKREPIRVKSKGLHAITFLMQRLIEIREKDADSKE